MKERYTDDRELRFHEAMSQLQLNGAWSEDAQALYEALNERELYAIHSQIWRDKDAMFNATHEFYWNTWCGIWGKLWAFIFVSDAIAIVTMTGTPPENTQPIHVRIFVMNV